MITGIDHVQVAIPAGGEAVARDLLRGLLAMAELPKPADLAVRGGCWFALVQPCCTWALRSRSPLPARHIRRSS